MLFGEVGGRRTVAIPNPVACGPKTLHAALQPRARRVHGHNSRLKSATAAAAVQRSFAR
jgi:hypothetical protein